VDFGAARRFRVAVFRRRDLTDADAGPALERRRIGHPKLRNYADLQVGLQQGFATGEMGLRVSFPRLQSWPTHVGFGSKADIEARLSDVRFTPKSGH